MDITILCKVVDNFGDIGVVYRLAKAISAIDKTVKLRIVTDNLDAFSKLEPKIDKNKAFQTLNNWQVYDWSAEFFNTVAFTKEPPSVILECFQCGRPNWLENLLFNVGVENIVNIINLDYLTAESYADDFHCLKSGTRSARVKKINFMPGFTSKTGGLIFDKTSQDAFRQRAIFAEQKLAVDKSLNTRWALNAEQTLNTGRISGDLREKNQFLTAGQEFNVLVFSYERSFEQIIESLALFKTDLLKQFNKNLVVSVASGLAEKPFFESYQKANTPFYVKKLEFLAQDEWDKILSNQDFLFVRGEESLSRACLLGVPFVWQAYVQEENYQLVKVQALLNRMESFFDKDLFALYSNFMLAYNTPKKLLPNFYTLLQNYDLLQNGFYEFSKSLYKNGDLAVNLLKFIDSLCSQKLILQ